jgi:uncharacterized phiE125 gp8 family phage protein
MSLASRCEYWWDDDIKFGLSVVTAPTAEPVSVSEVKANARIDIDDDDTLVARKITAARELAEVYIKRSFVTQTLRLTLDYMPGWMFYLPRPPLVSVTTVKYIDVDGVQQTIPSSDYIVDAYSHPGRITPAYNDEWPTPRLQMNAIEVVYVAGYGAASAVPQSIKDAIAMTVTQYYENRGDEGDTPLSELPRGAKSLLRSQSWGYLP